MSGNELWGVDSGGTIYRRLGISASKPGGTSWQLIPGRLADISVGDSGVWGVYSDGFIWYRTGTGKYAGNSKKGSGWKRVPGDLTTISSGKGLVYGTTRDNDIWVRLGISSKTPTGTKWKKIPGKLMEISVDTVSNSVWGCLLYTSPSPRD